MSILVSEGVTSTLNDRKTRLPDLTYSESYATVIFLNHKTKIKMKKFRSDYWPRIKEFEIVKETTQQIVYLDERGKEQREGKESQWHKWHETKEDAREYLTSVTNRKIETAKLQIVKYEKELSTIAAL